MREGKGNNKTGIDIKSLKPKQKKQFVKLIEQGNSAHEAFKMIFQTTSE